MTAAQTTSAPIEWGTKRIGDWIQTRSGIKFHLLDARPGDFAIEDIAHALANQCRFAGHTRVFYSVAEHSVRVARLIAKKQFGRRTIYSALMHDASDAYMLDMPRPFKYLPQFEFYKSLENDVMAAMAKDLCFFFPKPDIVHWADNVLLGTEARDLFDKPIGDWHMQYEQLPEKILPWSPVKAKREFLKMFYETNPLGLRQPKRSWLCWALKPIVVALALASVPSFNDIEPEAA